MWYGAYGGARRPINMIGAYLNVSSEVQRLQKETTTL